MKISADQMQELTLKSTKKKGNSSPQEENPAFQQIILQMMPIMESSVDPADRGQNISREEMPMELKVSGDKTSPIGPSAPNPEAIVNNTLENAYESLDHIMEVAKNMLQQDTGPEGQEQQTPVKAIPIEYGDQLLDLESKWPKKILAQKSEGEALPKIHGDLEKDWAKVPTQEKKGLQEFKASLGALNQAPLPESSLNLGKDQNHLKPKGETLKDLAQTREDPQDQETLVKIQGKDVWQEVSPGLEREDSPLKPGHELSRALDQAKEVPGIEKAPWVKIPESMGETQGKAEVRKQVVPRIQDEGKDPEELYTDKSSEGNLSKEPAQKLSSQGAERDRLVQQATVPHAEKEILPSIETAQPYKPKEVSIDNPLKEALEILFTQGEKGTHGLNQEPEALQLEPTDHGVSNKTIPSQPEERPEPILVPQNKITIENQERPFKPRGFSSQEADRDKDPMDHRTTPWIQQEVVFPREMPPPVQRFQPPVDIKNMQEILDTMGTEIKELKEGESSLIQVKLNPKELGEIEIRLEMKSGYLTGKILVQTPDTKGILDSQLQIMKDTLRDQNIMIQEIEVDLQFNNPEHHQRERNAFFQQEKNPSSKKNYGSYTEPQGGSQLKEISIPSYGYRRKENTLNLLA